MAEIRNISVEKIKVNPYQPRTHFDADNLYELAQSIKQNGLIQPIVVRELEDNNFEIIAGERRYRATMMIGKLEIPAIISRASDSASAHMALIENIQREDLSPIEEAYAYREILKHENMTQKQLAMKLGKSQSFIANKIRLLELPETVLSSVNEGVITERHARALLSVDKDKIDEVLDKVIKGKLNVKQTEALIGKPKKAKKPSVRGFAGHIQIGINSVKEAIEMVEKIGIVVNQEIDETEDEVVMTIRFPK